MKLKKVIKIPLVGKYGLNKYTIVDYDFRDLSNYRWYVSVSGYVVRGIYINKKLRIVYMHKLIKQHDNFVTDHINGNKLDNRKSNLRICNNFQNTQNSNVSKNNKLGIKDIYYYPKAKSYRVEIMGYGKRVRKYFKSIELAIEYRNCIINELHGKFSRI